MPFTSPGVYVMCTINNVISLFTGRSELTVSLGLYGTSLELGAVNCQYYQRVRSAQLKGCVNPL